MFHRKNLYKKDSIHRSNSQDGICIKIYSKKNFRLKKKIEKKN